MKVQLTAAIALAAHLFELELDTVTNDPEFHFEFNGWLDKYPGAISKADQLTSSPDNPFNAEAIQVIAKKIQEDFATGYWTKESTNEGLYNYMMTIEYGGYITDALDKQLAILTGVGIQQELFA